MDQINDFLKKLDELFKSKEKKLEFNNKKINNSNSKGNEEKKIISDIIKNINDVSKMKNSIEVLRKYSSESEINDIQLYIDLCNTLMPVLKEVFISDNKEKILSIIESISKRIIVVDVDKLKMENEILKRELDDINELKLHIIELELLESDMRMISKLCDELNILGKEKVKLISTIALLSMKKLYDKINIEEVVEECEIRENDEEIPLEVLKKLFNEHSINFSKLSDSKKQRLQKYGNIKNIEEILYLFEEYGIDINQKYNNGTIFSEISSIINIFIYAKASDMRNTLNILKEYQMINNSNTLVYALKATSIFVPRKRRYKTHNIRKGNDSGIILSGAMEDFSKNIEYMYDIYKGIILEKNSDIKEDDIKLKFQKEVYAKCSQFFAFPHEKVKSIITIFEKYNISRNSYINTLSSFASAGYSSKLDEFIEIDCYEYIKDNLSKLTDRSQINTLVFAKQKLGMTFAEMFKDKRQLSELRKSDSKLVLQLNNINANLKNADIYPKSMNPEASFISSEYDDVFKQIDEIVKREFEDGEVAFFDNYNFITNSICNKGYNYLNELLSLTDPQNPLICRIDGVPVSKNKILRIYNIYDNHSMPDSFDKLLYAITFNSHYTEEQFNTIKNKLRELGLKGSELK